VPNFVRAVFCRLTNLSKPDHVMGFFADLKQFGFEISRDDISGRRFHNTGEFPVSKLLADFKGQERQDYQIAICLRDYYFLEINMKWRFEDQEYPAMLEKKIIQDVTIFSLGVDEDAFFPPGQVVASLNDSLKFDTFRSVLSSLVSHLQPYIGFVDIECDYLCELSGESETFAYWGNFFSVNFLDTWNQADRSLLKQVVDQYFIIDDAGVLAFLQPLIANQAWTKNHEDLHSLISKYIKLTM
jgi:hypothetical protein